MTDTDRWELSPQDPNYPRELFDLPDPPARLYGYGDPELLGGGLAVIGTRRATPYGRACARRFAGWTAGQGIPVVSGAAIGCDLESHQAALDNEGPTVAVLGCGADIDYPRRAKDVLARVRLTGAVVSEAPWGSAVQRWAFPRRNRIIAALSFAILVVEASLPSGTFSTADHALSLGRDVYAVPGSIFAPECRGANRLIRQGATPITDVSELADALGVRWRETESPLCRHIDPLFRAVQANPARPDDLSRDLDIEIVAILRSLAQLESQGLVTRYSDGRYGTTVRGAGLQS